jgi:hypothetical protein
MTLGIREELAELDPPIAGYRGSFKNGYQFAAWLGLVPKQRLSEAAPGTPSFSSRSLKQVPSE